MRWAALACVATTVSGVGAVAQPAAPPVVGAIRVPYPEIPPPPLEGVPAAGRSDLRSLEQVLAETLEREPLDASALAEAYGELGMLYFAYGFRDSARAAWANAAAVDPSSFRWHYYLGALERLAGRLDRAAEELEAALAIDPDDIAALVRLGRVRIEQGRLDEAERSFERALAVAPRTAAALYGVGRIAVIEGRFEEALEPLEKALAGQPEGSTVHHQLGLAYRALGRLDEAREHLGRSRGVRVSFADPLMERTMRMLEGARVRARAGIRAQRAGRAELAVRLLEQAAALDPESAWIQYNLGVAYRDAGRSAAAAAAFERAVELDPSDRNAQFSLAQQLAGQGDFAGAERHFRRAAEIDPEDRQARLDLSVALSRLGRDEEALAELRRLIAEHPDFVEGRLRLATILARLGDVAEAEREAEGVLAGDSAAADRAAAHLVLGQLLESRDPAGALEHFAAAVELDPEETEARLALAMALGRSGRFDAAADEFDRLVEQSPEAVDLRLGQTMALLLGADYGRAERALVAARQQFPENIDLTHSLARLLATCPDESVRDGERALELAREALAERQSFDHAETVAMALAELGRFEEAASWQERVVQRLRAEGDPGRIGRAEEYLARYRRREPVRAPWMEDR